MQDLGDPISYKVVERHTRQVGVGADQKLAVNFEKLVRACALDNGQLVRRVLDELALRLPSPHLARNGSVTAHSVHARC